MPQFKLSSLELDEVSLVDRGANQLADVVLFKRATGCVLGKGAACDKMSGAVCTHENCTVSKTGDVIKGIKLLIGFEKAGIFREAMEGMRDHLERVQIVLLSGPLMSRQRHRPTPQPFRIAMPNGTF